MKTVGVVGLGLIGGSLARDLAGAGWRVLGTDRDPATVAAARESGVIDGPLRTDLLDVLVLAVPVGAVPAEVRRLAPELAGRGPGGRVILTDTGSTKRSAMAAAAAAGLGSRFVGSHPLAGDHRSGWGASRAGLFQGAVVHLCPGDAGPEAVRRVASLWEETGARPRPIDPAVHDRLMAHASHLPQLAASAVALALADAGVRANELGPGGRDVTRLAGSDPGVWTDILRDNADEVGPALDRLVDALIALRDAGEGGDPASHGGAGRRHARGEARPDAVQGSTAPLRALLKAARDWRYADPGEGKGPDRRTPRIRGEVGGKKESSR